MCEAHTQIHTQVTLATALLCQFATSKAPCLCCMVCLEWKCSKVMHQHNSTPSGQGGDALLTLEHIKDKAGVGLVISSGECPPCMAHCERSRGNATRLHGGRPCFFWCLATYACPRVALLSVGSGPTVSSGGAVLCVWCARHTHTAGGSVLHSPLSAQDG